MTRSQNNYYSEEFKINSARLAYESDQQIKQTAIDLGVKPTTLHTWISKYIKSKDNISSSSDSTNLELEIKRLRKENMRLKEEREILKKATAYFAKAT